MNWCVMGSKVKTANYPVQANKLTKHVFNYMKKIEDMTPEERQEEEKKDYVMKLFIRAENCKRDEKRAYEKYKSLRKKTDEAKWLLKDYCDRHNLTPPQ